MKNFKLLWFIILNIIKGYVKNVPAFILTLLAPSLFGILILVMTKPGAESFRPVGIVNNNTGVLSETIENTASINGKAKLVTLTEGNWEKTLNDKKVAAVVLVPEGYEKTVLEGKTGKISVVSLAGDQTGMWIQSNLNALLQNVNDFGIVAKGNGETFHGLLKEYNAGAGISVTTLNDLSNNKSVEIGGIGLLAWIIFIVCSLYTIRLVSDRENNTMRRISATRAGGKIFVSANVLAASILAIVQVVFASIILYGFGILKYTPMAGFLAVLLPYAVVSIAIGAFIASINKTTSNAILMIVMGSSILSMLGGMYWPIEFTPKFMQVISYFTPQGWFMRGNRLMTESTDLSVVIPSVVMMLAFAATFLIAASFAQSRRSTKGL
ncbi:MAG: hypothetical protein BGN88_13730 [Clostridiales bacterium 43-6]|nr:MAG: hypothetical protein BGN88_13730 [Clostridiales bacterium 43-6]